MRPATTRIARFRRTRRGRSSRALNEGYIYNSIMVAADAGDAFAERYACRHVCDIALPAARCLAPSTGTGRTDTSGAEDGPHLHGHGEQSGRWESRRGGEVLAIPLVERGVRARRCVGCDGKVVGEHPGKPKVGRSDNVRLARHQHAGGAGA